MWNQDDAGTFNAHRQANAVISVHDGTRSCGFGERGEREQLETHL